MATTGRSTPHCLVVVMVTQTISACSGCYNSADDQCVSGCPSYADDLRNSGRCGDNEYEDCPPCRAREIMQPRRWRRIAVTADSIVNSRHQLRV